MTILSYAQIVDVARRAGLPAPEFMAHVALAESSGVIEASSGQALGLFQINPSAWPMFDRGALQHDPLYNARAALYVLQNQGISAWNPSRNAGDGGGWGRYLDAKTAEELNRLGRQGSLGQSGGPLVSGGGGGNILRRGSTGPYVTMLQQKLGIPVDGIYGPQTEAAVRTFQATHGLSVDGVVGPQTTNAMFFAPGNGGGSTGFAPASGIVWPSDTRTISQPFGAQNGHDNGGHPGVDIAAPMNSPIYAATSGRVISAGPASGFGQWIRIQAPDGTVTVYGHMYPQNMFVKVGDTVQAGQRIALVGANGNSTGPHLHFEVHQNINAGPEDPIAFLNSHGATSAGQAQQGDGVLALSAELGVSQALFNLDPELQGVLAKAEQEGLQDNPAGKAAFQALLMNTNWWKTHSQAQRDYLSLGATDPSTQQREFLSALADVIKQAQQMGVALTVNQQWIIAQDVAMFKLSGNEMQLEIARAFKTNPDAAYGGQIGDTINQLKQLSQDYGYPQIPAQLNAAATDILQGKKTLQDYENSLRGWAKSIFPALSTAIDDGQTVRQAAAPYLAQYQNILGVDAANVDLSKDQTIRKALNMGPPATTVQTPTGSQSFANGKTTVTPPANAMTTTNGVTTQKPFANEKSVQGPPQLMPLWQFEQQLRQDPRWLQTQDAADQLSSAGTTVLKDFGLVAPA